MPKALRPFFRHDRRLFAEVSRLIYQILREFYNEAAGRQLLTGMVIAHQTFGDMLRWNPHFHETVLEGGFDEWGTFFYIPFSGLQSMTELFRCRVIKLLLELELLNDDFSRNLLSWKHSGFSIDNSVRILDQSSQESLAEYIVRPPISLKKIRYEPFKGRVLFHTTYSECFKENLHMFDALDFLAQLTRSGLVRQFDLRTAQHHPAEATAADSPLRVVRFPNEGAVGRNAEGCRASAGGVESGSQARRRRR